MILLRPLVTEDAVALFPLLMGVKENLLMDEVETEAALESAVNGRLELAEEGNLRAFTIVEAESGVSMGMVHLKFDLLRSWGEMGIWLGKPFQGHGFGTEAIAQVVEMGWRELGLKRIEAQIFDGNEASRKAFENNDFRVVAWRPKSILQRGAYRDVWVLAASPGREI